MWVLSLVLIYCLGRLIFLVQHASIGKMYLFYLYTLILHKAIANIVCAVLAGHMWAYGDFKLGGIIERGPMVREVAGGHFLFCFHIVWTQQSKARYPGVCRVKFSACVQLCISRSVCYFGYIFCMKMDSTFWTNWHALVSF